MGQQQLLLLVLGIVIVGLAVVVGLQAFTQNQQKSVVDGLSADVVEVLSAHHTWALKPVSMGGGGGRYDIEGEGAPTLGQLGYTVSDESAYIGTYQTPNGGIATSFTSAQVARYMSFNAEREVRVAGAICGTPTGEVQLFTSEVPYGSESAEMDCDGTTSSL